MAVRLQPAPVATSGRRLRRGRSSAGSWRRLILAVALIVAAFTALLTRTRHLHLPIISGLTPSAFASTDSYGLASIISPFNSSISASIATSDTRTVEAKGSHSGHLIPLSNTSETRLKEAISKASDVPAYSTQEVPFWALPPNEALLYAKKEIEHAPLVSDDPDLYAPLYWNISVFKRSYELMERILKVYIYSDGSRPIFHTPELHGIYASEGWFMKLMEESRRFVVNDPKKAHLFYLPYSSRKLRDTIYTPGSHNIRPLAIFLRDYVNIISSKYPFWNRSSGSDHFLVACHDWGPYSTILHTELCKNTIKALCNADTSEGIFIRGKDVSLPETTIKFPKRPLKYIGGKRVSQRPILAFYAGLMHGRVRPSLEKLWGNDTEGDIRIFRRLPNRVSRNMSYVEHMKSSRFCICPMGYEVNSPRIVEAIYYECVPVIIADNFVLPFEEVLDWSTFSVVVAEKDIADLRDILLSIPLRKYLEMQNCVRRVQKHFLWHAKPERYDLYHVILHSIWFSRLNQIEIPL